MNCHDGIDSSYGVHRQQPVRAHVQRPPESGSAPKTLSDLLARLEAVNSRDRRHGEMKSALRMLGKVLRRNLSEVSADPILLRQLVANATPAAAGFSKLRWGRIRSLTLMSLREAGLDMTPGRDLGGRSSAWQLLTDALPSQKLRIGLSRFMSHCTRRGIEPNDVDATVFARFRNDLFGRSLQANPGTIYRRTLQFWNRAASANPAWPQFNVLEERHPRYYSLPWKAFPESFALDVEAFLEDKGKTDIFEDDYVKAVRPSTVALRRRQIRQLASLLVSTGFPAADLTNLSVLATPANAKAALKAKHIKQGDRSSVSLAQEAWLLCVIARHWSKVGEHAVELRRLAKSLDQKQSGMTERNRGRLRQFELPANVGVLLGLPDRVIARSNKSAAQTEREAREVMLALAVEVLIVAPMRVRNLCGLEIDRHFVETGRGRNRNRHIIIPREETKTNEPFEAILPPGSASLMDLYLKTYRPRICQEPSLYLFPNSTGGAREVVSFSQSISKFVERETGLIMHAHLFRHLAAKLHLDAHPGDIETARRLLQHKDTKTTLTFYTEHRTKQAFSQYDLTLSKLRPAPEGGKSRRPGHDGRSSDR